MRKDFSVTEEQEAVISALARSSVQCIAPAGSGKTSLIVRCAERYPADNFLVLAYNKTLQLDVEEKVRKSSLTNVSCKTFHGLGESYGPCHDDTMMQEIIRSDTSLLPKIVTRYTVVIVDEAQDLSPSYFSLIFKYLRDIRRGKGMLTFAEPEGISDIRFLVMGDPHQAVYQYNGADSRFLTLASTVFGVQMESLSLKGSHRIPFPVASFINKHILKEEVIIPLSKKKNFPPVSIILTGGAEVALEMIVAMLGRKDGISPGDIFVLASSGLSNGMGSNKPIHRLESLLTDYNKNLHPDSRFPCYFSNDSCPKQAIEGRIVFSTCHSTKGTERKVVFIFLDRPDQAKQESLPNHIYVGMTRATEKLILVCSDFLPLWVRGLQELSSDPLISMIGNWNDRVHRGKNCLPLAVSALSKFTNLGSVDEIRSLIAAREPTGSIPYPISAPSKIQGCTENISPLIGTMLPSLCYKLINGEVLENLIPYQERALEAFSRSPGCSHASLQIRTDTPWLRREDLAQSAAWLRETVSDKEWKEEYCIERAVDVDKLLGPLREDYIVSRRYIILRGRVDFISTDGKIIVECKTKGTLSTEDLTQAALYLFIARPALAVILINLETGEKIRIMRDEAKLRGLVTKLLCSYMRPSRDSERIFIEKAKKIRYIYE